MPVISLNCRRTSSTIRAAARPTAFMVRPENMKAISEAANAHNGEALRLAAHTLKGLIGHFVVGPAYEAAHRLEIQGANDDLNGVSEAFTALEKEIERLRPALTELTQTVEGSA